MSLVRWIDQRKHWWKVFVLIFSVSVVVVGYIGYKTYEYAPPICDFVDESGDVVFAAEDITAGQQVFFRVANVFLVAERRTEVVLEIPREERA